MGVDGGVPVTPSARCWCLRSTPPPEFGFSEGEALEPLKAAALVVMSVDLLRLGGDLATNAVTEGSRANHSAPSKQPGKGHLFINGGSKPLSNMAMLELLKGMRSGVTTHGFRLRTLTKANPGMVFAPGGSPSTWGSHPGTVGLDASENACLDMAGGSNPTFSLFQRNARALRAERVFGVQALRTTALASVSGATYSVSSPA